MPGPDQSLPPDARDDATKVRQGRTLGVMRWVLAASLVIVVVALAVAFAVMRTS
jgi:hypothetical protein